MSAMKNALSRVDTFFALHSGASFGNGVAKTVIHIQLKPFANERLLNKPYENEVTLTGQNPLLKCY